jgi:aspartate aminotransferase
VKIARRAASVSASATLDVLRAASAMRARGIDIVDLGPGEPDFPTPEFIKEAAIGAIRANYTKYTDAVGTSELRFAIAERYRRAWNAPYQSSQVVVTAGGKQALHTACLALFEEGDDVLIPSPYWVSFPEMVKLTGARPVFVPTSGADGFRVTADAIEAGATPATRGLILNTPNNPTGAVMDPREIEKTVRLAASRGWTILFDECYDRFVYTGSHLSAASLAREYPETVLVAATLSKTYAMTGWRIGFALGPQELIDTMGRIIGHATSNVCSITQKAGLFALTNPDESEAEIRVMLSEYRRRRDVLIPALNRLPGVTCAKPGGAFYAFPDFSAHYGKHANGSGPIKGSADMCRYLLERAAVAVTPGIAFGEDRCVRISFATSLDRLEEGVNRIGRALEELG